MESIISLLSDIENEANSIINSALEKKNIMYKELEKKLHDIDNNYNNMLNNDLDKLQHECDLNLKQELESVQKSSDNDIHILEEKYKAKYKSYLNILFENIINQE